MIDPPAATGPNLADTDGNPIEIGNDATRAFREAVQNGTFEPSAPLDLWWSLSRPDGGGVHLKVTAADNGRWDITGVYVHGRGLTATDLQAVPLTQLDLTMNLLGYWDDKAVMDPSVIAETINDYAASAGYGPAVMHNLDDEHEPSLAELRALAADAPPELPDRPAAERPRLTRPDGTDADGFAAKVAAAYREYAAKTRAPAAEIAKEADVPIATVRSWIREARRRGKLPEGRKGKAG